jgi:uncharacterized membrane protein (DUF2068 family)
MHRSEGLVELRISQFMLAYADSVNVEEEYFRLSRWHSQRWNDYIAIVVCSCYMLTGLSHTDGG